MNNANRIRQWFCFILCLLTIIAICTGCAASKTTNVFRETQYYTEEYLQDQTLRSISIGNTEYSVQYQSSKRSSFDLKMCHRYTVGSGDPCGTIWVDSAGNWTYFSLLYPFDPIMNIESLSDEEVKAAAETIMGDAVDFSVYNTFSINKIATGYQLQWQIKRELPCNISLIVYLDSDGAIYSASKNNACPNDLSESFVSIEQRDALIFETLSSRALQKGEEFAPAKIKVTTEMLSLYEGNRSILYTVGVTDANGYVSVYPIVIMQTENGLTCLY